MDWLTGTSNEADDRCRFDGFMQMAFDAIIAKRKAENIPDDCSHHLVAAWWYMPGEELILMVSTPDPNHRGKDKNSIRVSHAEREVLVMAIAKHGEAKASQGILGTTLSPCNLSRHFMQDRIGCSCQDRVLKLNIRVYSAIHDTYQAGHAGLQNLPYRGAFTNDQSLIEQGLVNWRMIRPPEENNFLNGNNMPR